MIQCTKISAEQLDHFVINHPYGHYMKTSMWGQVQQALNHEVQYWGFIENGTLKATALLLIKHQTGITSFYIPLGPCVDYENEELTRLFLQQLITQAEVQKADFLRIDPNVLRMEKDIQGNPIEDGKNNEMITTRIKQLGFRHKGYGYAYNGSWTNRFTLLVDLSSPMDDIVKHYSKARQNSLRRHAVIGVSTQVGNSDSLQDLCNFECQLAQIQGFKPHSQEFFQRILDSFKQHAVLYVTSIDLNQMIQGIRQEINSGKYNKDKEALQSKLAELSKAETLMSTYGNTPTIAAGLFLRLNNQCWDCYTYNHKDFNFIKAVDHLHRFAMEDMKNHGVIWYDMCGFSGVCDKSDPYYGLYDYKRSFGSQYTERIGEFDYVFHPLKFKSWKKADHYLRALRRKVHQIQFKKKEKCK